MAPPGKEGGGGGAGTGDGGGAAAAAASREEIFNLRSLTVKERRGVESGGRDETITQLGRNNGPPSLSDAANLVCHASISELSTDSLFSSSVKKRKGKRRERDKEEEPFSNPIYREYDGLILTTHYGQKRSSPVYS